MEFSFPFKLKDGSEITVTADVSEDECLLGLTFPVGCRLATSLFDAYGRVEDIEARAIEEYRERRNEQLDQIQTERFYG